ncbi:hypothetical protein Syun_031241 [Stephania yunnanensis]|uniref:Uncharacterized protein n=1 Tax=Stephania yunnanensis TaxID=152371 RepID=A0AAP0HGC1_9MAGN
MHNSDHVILLEYYDDDHFLIKYHFCRNHTDQLALLAFKSQISQGPLQVLNSWNTSSIFANGRASHAVVASKSGEVGSLPYDLGNLSSLQVIDLASNFLEGGIPDSIGQLKNLYFLSLEENMLSSKLPPSIYNLSSLSSLGLTMNQIVDRLPSDIGRTFLPNLRELFIGENHFFGPLPSSLFNISTLEMLELSKNGFTGKVPDNMGNMQKLYLLGLSFNNQTWKLAMLMI